MSEQIQAYMYEAVKNFFDGRFDGQKWRYALHDEVVFVGAIEDIDSKINSLRFSVIVGEDTVCCYHIVPVKVPVEKRAAVCEFITRANYGLTLGNFELDMNDGEIRYKVTLLSHDLLRSQEAALGSMKLLMLLAPAVWKRYGNQLADMIFDICPDKSVEELIAQCENAE